MPLALSDRTIHEVAGQFAADVFDRGLAAARGGRVMLVRAEWPVVARVRGEPGHVVTVHRTPETRHLRGECSCPARVDCEHAAAAALVALDGAATAAAARDAARRQQAVSRWLAGLTIETERAAEDRGPQHVAAYVIARHEEALALTVHRTTALRRGGFGPSSVLAHLGVSPGRGAPRWMAPDDLRRITLLRAMAQVGELDSAVDLERLDRETLADLAGSGRLFWEAVGTRPLAAGPARAGRLRWREADAAGELAIGLEGELVLLPARDIHYIDPAAALIGPLDLGLPAALIQRLTLAPPVPAAMLGAVRRSLAPLLAPHGAAAADLVPAAGGAAAAAQDLAPDAAGDEPLRPHLTVGPAADDGDGDDRWCSGLELRAEAIYGEERFELGAWDPRRPAARDMAAEGGLAHRLEELMRRFDPDPDRGRRSVELLREARHLVREVVPVLLAEGWTCDVSPDLPVEPPEPPAGWVEQLRPVAGARGWFAVELGVVIAGRTVSLLPILLDAIRGGQLPLDAALLDADHLAGLTVELPEGQRVHVTGERLRRWLRPLVELELRGLDRGGQLLVPDLDAAELEQLIAERAAAGAAGPLAHGAPLARARARAAALLSLEPRAEAAGFGGALRAYQRQGLAWLHLLHEGEHGGLLADDMGLGKTVQVLAFLHGLHRAGELTAEAPALVVTPRSVVGHWVAEAGRFAPALAPVLHLGPRRAIEPAGLRAAPLVVTSYQTLQRDVDLLREIRWTTILFDEAQALKNPATRLRRAAASLPARSRFGLTGTPVENHLTELWSQIDLVLPGLLGRRSTFEAIFRRPVERHGEVRLLELLRRRIRPFLLRRTKGEVALELPPRSEMVEQVELGAAQRDLYESVRLSLDDEVRAALRARGVQGSSLVVLDALLRLRQVCCDPRLLGTPEARRVKGSAKLERLMEMLRELTEAGRSVLVFSQFTSMLRLIDAACRAAGLRFLTLTGQTRRRDEVVQGFQAGEAPILLVSLKAGGTGLHLTRADTVIHYDPWWNPAAEDQASDRAHRIGQDRAVFIYKLVARGTLEERIAALQERKRALTRAALERGGASHLVPDDLAALYHELV